MQTFKYKKSNLNVIGGLIWTMIGIIYILFFIFFMSKISNIVTFAFLMAAIPNLILGYFHLNLYKRDYIYLDKYTMTIDRGLVILKYTFDIRDITTTRQVGNKLRFRLKSGKEYRIILSSLGLEDMNTIEGLIEDMKS